MNNLLSYCGLVDARISASEEDLPVHTHVEISKFIFAFALYWLQQTKSLDYTGSNKLYITFKL